MKNPAFLLYSVLFLSLSGCKKEPTVEPIKEAPAVTANKEITNWIYDTMKEWYLWNDNLVAKSTTDLTLTPDKYFDAILYQKGETDRFSWIQESVDDLRNSLQGINKSYGYRFKLFSVAGSDRVIVSVSYPIKGGPAERAGIKRGDVFTKVNGTTLTTANYSTLLYGTPDTYTLTYGQYNADKSVSDLDKTVKVVAEEVTENPVFYSKVITKGTKKIGYLVYNQFISTYDNELRTVFADFKSKGVNELILDLRLNPGGFISSAQVLSSLVCKNNSTNNVFSVDEWNNGKKQYWSEKRFLNEANNIGTLSRVFVLTTTSTASASELVMNSLSPFMEVVQVGDNTYGKNVGSITLPLPSDPKPWKWGMQPIVFRTANSKRESNYGSKTGFSPKAENVQKDNVLPFLPFGDENETLLKKALGIITGTTARVSARVAASPFEEVSDSKQADAFQNGMFVTEFPKQ